MHSQLRTLNARLRRSLAGPSLQRHFIHATRTPGIAAEYALNTQPAAAQGAVARDGFFGIARTCRIETALLAEKSKLLKH